MRLRSIAHLVLIVIFVLVNLSVFITPYLAMKGDSLANKIYDFYIPLDHQYIYRSFCLFSFSNGNGLWIDECIPPNSDEKIITKTLFTSWNNKYDGIFYYNKEDVGFNRVDFLIKEGGVVGYKFPVCARDTGFYIGLLIGALFYYRIFSERDYFPFSFFIMAAIPIGVDGFLQLLTVYESTVYFRFTTGIMSGILLGILIIGNFISKINK